MVFHFEQIFIHKQFLLCDVDLLSVCKSFQDIMNERTDAKYNVFRLEPSIFRYTQITIIPIITAVKIKIEMSKTWYLCEGNES